MFSFLAEPPENFESKKERALSQPIAILARDRSSFEDSETFEMSGSGGSKYVVQIKLVPSCTCADFKFRRSSCKHIIYVSFMSKWHWYYGSQLLAIPGTSVSHELSLTKFRFSTLRSKCRKIQDCCIRMHSQSQSLSSS